MTYHKYKGYTWYQCDECGATVKGEKYPGRIGLHSVGMVHNICPKHTIRASE